MRIIVLKNLSAFWGYKAYGVGVGTRETLLAREHIDSRGGRRYDFGRHYYYPTKESRNGSGSRRVSQRLQEGVR